MADKPPKDTMTATERQLLLTTACCVRALCAEAFTGVTVNRREYFAKLDTEINAVLVESGAAGV